jgi:hypothetical protein
VATVRSFASTKCRNKCSANATTLMLEVSAWRGSGEGQQRATGGGHVPWSDAAQGLLSMLPPAPRSLRPAAEPEKLCTAAASLAPPGAEGRGAQPVTAPPATPAIL